MANFSADKYFLDIGYVNNSIMKLYFWIKKAVIVMSQRRKIRKTPHHKKEKYMCFQKLVSQLVTQFCLYMYLVHELFHILWLGESHHKCSSAMPHSGPITTPERVNQVWLFSLTQFGNSIHIHHCLL